MCKKWENERAQQYGDTYWINIKQHGRNFSHSTRAVWASSLIVTKFTLTSITVTRATVRISVGLIDHVLSWSKFAQLTYPTTAHGLLYT